MDHQQPTICPLCWRDLIQRVYGKWCPRCRGWAILISIHGSDSAYWHLDQGSL